MFRRLASLRSWNVSRDAAINQPNAYTHLIERETMTTATQAFAANTAEEADTLQEGLKRLRQLIEDNLDPMEVYAVTCVADYVERIEKLRNAPEICSGLLILGPMVDSGIGCVVDSKIGGFKNNCFDDNPRLLDNLADAVAALEEATAR